MNKINILGIVKDNHATLGVDIHREKNNISWIDIFFFYITTLIFFLFFCIIFYLYGAPTSILTPLVAILSIFASMLFSFQVMICDQIFKITDIKNFKTDRDKDYVLPICYLLKDTYINISYCIIIALCALILTLISSISCSIIILSAVLALFEHFLIFLLMIIKRSQILIDEIARLRINSII